jgi:oxygen-independent coproporphyrinogen III oxidase
MNELQRSALLKKYDVPTPRYTSYPVVPTWDVERFDIRQWKNLVRKSFEESNREKGISIYIHLPFCESLCTYCACNTRITKNHAVEIPYIQAVLKEWEQYKTILGDKPVVRELHLGGGTPTFFDVKNLRWLITYLLEGVEIHPDFEFSFEGHPNNTSLDHLKCLFDLGFRRVSFGVQDLDEKVQKTIHRIQPFENLERVTTAARNIGYKSISYDLIYGLPFQTPFTVSDTIDKILSLHPDRLSFYSYAHVPWLRPGQRGYGDGDLPSNFLKRHLYEIGRHKMRKAGYSDIGMDHFSLPGDDLFKASVTGTLHRNFMGYTTNQTDLLIGLGVSAISDAHYAYGQNVKKLEDYLNLMKTGELPIVKGHILTEEDLLIKQCILQISCQGELDGDLFSSSVDKPTREKLSEMEAEGILYLLDDSLKITSIGEPFIRNICRVFDRRLDEMEFQTQTFSRSI